MNFESFDGLLEEVRGDRVARTAARENGWRREIAKAFEAARAAKGWSVRKMALEMETSVSQVQRLLHETIGGSVTLMTICRAADCLDLHVAIHVRPKSDGVCAAIVPMSEMAAWHRAEWTQPPRAAMSSQQLILPGSSPATTARQEPWLNSSYFATSERGKDDYDEAV